MKPTRRTMNQTVTTGKIEASNAATTSRMRKYRNKLYLDPVKHELVKAKEEDYNKLIKILDDVHQNKPVTYYMWEKVDNPTLSKTGKKSNQISKKVPHMTEFKKFINELKEELSILFKHLNRVHMQFKEFKKARNNGMDADTFTVHIDWSENARLRQAAEERSAYYHEDNISIHAMHAWYDGKEQSLVSLSDNTDHSAPAVWTSLKPVLTELLRIVFFA